MKNELAVLSGTSNPQLAGQICDYLGVEAGKVSVSRFPDGELHVKINEDMRGRDVFVVQSTCSPPNENLMELLIFLDTLRRSSARRITAVLPYFGYARQDRKDQPRVPITAKLVANLITKAGADRVLTVDLHAGQIQGFFDIPVDHLFAVNVFVEHILTGREQEQVVVSPDVGGLKMARAYAKRLNAGLAVVDKRRSGPFSTEVMNIMGEVSGKNCILVDDMTSTAGSLVEAAEALVRNGAKSVCAAVTHAVLAGSAVEKIDRSSLKELITTNTIPLRPEKKSDKITVLSVGELLGEAIKRIHNEESVSSLFATIIA